MTDTPNILQATAKPDRCISVHFENGIKAIFNFEKYFTYSGYYTFLKDTDVFLNVKIKHNSNYIYWIDEAGEEIEIDSSILYAICTQEKIIINGKTVFDPSLGKEAWL